jgi:predicted secreted protein
MPITTCFAVYFIIWWLVLFTVLPWGIRSQHESGTEMPPGTDPGAPALPNLRRKLIWTTLVAAVIFAAFDFAFTEHLVTLGGIIRPPAAQ